MTNQELKDSILKIEPEAQVDDGKQYLTLTISPEKLHALAFQLKNKADLAFDYLFNLSGVDYGDALGVVYHMESTLHHHVAVVKVYTSDRENPHFDTVSDIWKTADFLEREVFDFFGIKFTNHPDLRRIFLDEEWVGFPLRKDYKPLENAY